MDGLGTITLALMLLGMFGVSLAAPVHEPELNNPTECKSCEPGTGVSIPCGTTHDTVCTPCPDGYFSPRRSSEEKCFPCSLCGAGLFEIHPCSSTNDVVCELCIKAYLPENEDFVNKCNPSQDSLEGNPDQRVKHNPLKRSKKGIKTNSNSEISKMGETKPINDFHNMMAGDEPIPTDNPVPEHVPGENEMGQVKEPLLQPTTPKSKDDIKTTKYIYSTYPLPEIDKKEADVNKNVFMFFYKKTSTSTEKMLVNDSKSDSNDSSTNSLSVIDNEETDIIQEVASELKEEKSNPKTTNAVSQATEGYQDQSVTDQATKTNFKDIVEPSLQSISNITFERSTMRKSTFHNRQTIKEQAGYTDEHITEDKSGEDLEVTFPVTTSKTELASDITDIYQDDQLLPIIESWTQQYNSEKTTTALELPKVTGVPDVDSTDVSVLEEGSSDDHDENSTGESEESSGSGDIELEVLLTTPKVVATTKKPYQYTRKKWLPFRRRTTATTTTPTRSTAPTALTSTEQDASTLAYLEEFSLPFILPDQADDTSSAATSFKESRNTFTTIPTRTAAATDTATDFTPPIMNGKSKPTTTTENFYTNEKVVFETGTGTTELSTSKGVVVKLHAEDPIVGETKKKKVPTATLR